MSKALFVFALLFALCYSVSLPGMPRETYTDGKEVEVKTRKLSSFRNLPYEFYKVKFCRPVPLERSAENLGEHLFGDIIENSVQFKQEVLCRKIETCTDETKCEPVVECPSELSKDDVEEFRQMIEEDYNAQLIIDNLPVANRQDADKKHCGSLPFTPDVQVEKYSRPDGFPIGCKFTDKETRSKRYFINNHYTFIIRYHEGEDGENTIVGAEVVPSSVAHTDESCVENQPIPRTVERLQLTDDLKHIPYSYSVHWVKSNIKWASRWDAYLATSDSEEYKIHWFSIINSLMIVLFLTGMVAMIMLRVLHKDITYYNRQDQEDPAEETGWKLVHGDVFRSPNGFTLLSILTGSGVQVLAMALIALVFALLGFLSPASRGSLATVSVLLFVFMGIFAGYYTLRFYKMFGGTSWKTVAILTAFLFPGVIFTLFLIINFVLWVVAHSSGAIPFSNLISLIGMWFGVSVPLVFLGSYFGFKKPAIENPCQTHRIPRQIPEQPVYMQAPFSVLMGGILPFGAVFIELYFIMSSLWLQKFYYVFGFLFLVFLILLLTCAEITIVMIYFQLCNEDYRWWWRAYLTAGSSAFYMFLYSVFYFFTKMHVDSVVMGVVFFGYTLILSYFFFVLTGSVGFFATLWFVRKIYGSIKVE